MKKILLTLRVVIAVLGLFAVTGYAGYRYGYVQGVQATVNGDVRPGLRPLDNFGPRGCLCIDLASSAAGVRADTR